MGTDTTRAVVEEYYRVVGRDRVRLLELLDPEVTWTPPPGAPIASLRGAEAVADTLGRDFVKKMFDLSKPFAIEIRRLVADGDVAVVQQRLTGTAKATGAAYDNQYCWVYTVRDGRIVDMEEYADTMVAARAFGWEL